MSKRLLPNGLNIKQDELARFLASGMNQTEAAKAAGMNVPYVSELLKKNPLIMQEVERLRAPGIAKAAEKAEVNAAWVFDGIIKIREEGLKQVPIVARGEVVGDKPNDLGAAARATELGAKLLGMMVERQSIELSGEAKRVLEEVIQAVVAEVDDPAVRERIMARLAGEGLGVASIPN